MASLPSTISLSDIPAAVTLFKANTFTQQDEEMFMRALVVYTSALLDAPSLNPNLNQNPYHFSLYTQQQMALSTGLLASPSIYMKHVLYFISHIPGAVYTDVHVVDLGSHFFLYDRPLRHRFNVADVAFSLLVQQWYLNPLDKTFLVVPLLEASSATTITHAVLAVLKKNATKKDIDVLYLDSQGTNPVCARTFQNILQNALPLNPVNVHFSCPQLQGSNIDCHQWQTLFMFLFLLDPADFDKNVSFLKTASVSQTNINIIVFQMFMFFMLVSFDKYDVGDIYYHQMRGPLHVDIPLRTTYEASEQRLRDTIQQLFSVHNCSNELNDTDCSRHLNCTFCGGLCLNRRVVNSNSSTTGCQPAGIKDIFTKMFGYHDYFVQRGLIPGDITRNSTIYQKTLIRF